MSELEGGVTVSPGMDGGLPTKQKKRQFINCFSHSVTNSNMHTYNYLCMNEIFLKL